MKRGSSPIVLILLIAMILVSGFIFLISFLVVIRYQGGELDKATGEAVDCSGVASVKPQYLPWVKEASEWYLDKDEAALIALIQIESGWNPNSANATSSAKGLGQFLIGTASGYKEYMGGTTDSKGKDWPKGQLYVDNNPSDARYEPERSIYATARKLGSHIKDKGNLRDAYIEGYHGGGHQNTEANTGADRLMDTYNKLKSGGGCKSSASASTFVCEKYEYAFPVGFMSNASYGKFHHNYSATDIFVKENGRMVEGAPIYSVTSGTVNRAGDDGSLGGTRVTIVGDDKYIYYYAHLQEGSVQSAGIRNGDKVKSGQQIGKLGSTGNAQSTSPHLHFGISKQGFPTKGWFPAQVENEHDQVSNWKVLDNWKEGKCIDPAS